MLWFMAGREVDKQRLWALELSMRSTMVRRFQQLQGNALKDRIMKNLTLTDAYGTQNDGDEFISGSVSSGENFVLHLTVLSLLLFQYCSVLIGNTALIYHVLCCAIVLPLASAFSAVFVL